MTEKQALVLLICFILIWGGFALDLIVWKLERNKGMTVKQLINKLQKMPEDATVYVENNNAYINGAYKVVSSEVDYFDNDNTVLIGTDYKYIEE